MRHFIYLDNDLLLSYYSQAFDGLEKSRQMGISDATSETHHSEVIRTKGGLTGSVGNLIFGLGGGFEGETTHPYTIYVENQTANELVTKTMHDNILDAVMEHAETKKDVCSLETPSVGKYINLKLSTKFFDVDYLLDIMNEDFLQVIWHNTYNRSLANALPNLNMSPQNAAKAKDKAARKDADDEQKGIENTIRILKAMRSVLPFRSFCYTQNVIVPFAKKNLKEEIQHCMYKYEGDVRLFGRITKIGFTMFRSESRDIFSELNDSLFELIRSFMEKIGVPNVNDLLVVAPLAIFYE